MTDYVRAQTDGYATFMIIREVRFDATGTDPGDIVPESSSMWIASRNHPTTSYWPALEIVAR